MPDFVAIARALKDTPDIEAVLKAMGFRLLEPLSQKLPREGETCADYASEIWLRRHPDHYLAVRIDWQGHPGAPAQFHGRPAHFHFESFPVASFDAYLIGPAAGVVRYDTTTGLPSTDFAATHGRIRVLP